MHPRSIHQSCNFQHEFTFHPPYWTLRLLLDLINSSTLTVTQTSYVSGSAATSYPPGQRPQSPANPLPPPFLGAGSLSPGPRDASAYCEHTLIQTLESWDFHCSPAVKTLCFHCSGAWVQFLGREHRSRMLCLAAKKQTNKKQNRSMGPKYSESHGHTSQDSSQSFLYQGLENPSPCSFLLLPKQFPKRVQILEVRAMNRELSCPEHIYKSRLIT